MLRWRVRLADGRRLDSARHSWDDVVRAGGVLVVRVWEHPKYGDMVLWGDAYYGDPATLAIEGRVRDDEWERVLAEEQADSTPPGDH